MLNIVVEIEKQQGVKKLAAGSYNVSQKYLLKTWKTMC